MKRNRQESRGTELRNGTISFKKSEVLLTGRYLLGTEKQCRSTEGRQPAYFVLGHKVRKTKGQAFCWLSRVASIAVKKKPLFKKRRGPKTSFRDGGEPNKVRRSTDALAPRGGKSGRGGRKGKTRRFETVHKRRRGGGSLACSLHLDATPARRNEGVGEELTNGFRGQIACSKGGEKVLNRP